MLLLLVDHLSLLLLQHSHNLHLQAIDLIFVFDDLLIVLFDLHQQLADAHLILVLLRCLLVDTGLSLRLVVSVATPTLIRAILHCIQLRPCCGLCSLQSSNFFFQPVQLQLFLL